MILYSYNLIQNSGTEDSKVYVLYKIKNHEVFNYIQFMCTAQIIFITRFIFYYGRKKWITQKW